MTEETPFEIPETRIVGASAHTTGVAGTTPIHLHERSDKERMMDLKPGDMRRPRYEVRVGISLFGGCNMEPHEFEACGYNPFHPDFRDNYATGNGNTEEDALASLLADMEETTNSLFI